jgi:hypothetical protein
MTTIRNIANSTQVIQGAEKGVCMSGREGMTANRNIR